MSSSALAFQPASHVNALPPSIGPRAVPPLGDTSGMARQALDVLNDGLIVADALSRVLYINRAAEGLVSSGALAIRAGVLCAETPAETRALQAAVADRARTGATDAYVKTGGGRTRRSVLFIVTATPVSEADSPSTEPTVLIFARQLNAVQSPSPQMIGTFFGLTPAEARLAYEMIKGDGMKPCARRLGITANTARTHLKHVFEKTGTRRQAELVRLLFSCGASVGARCLATAEAGRSARPLGQH